MTFKDEVMPEGKWEFDEEVTKVFDEMLERSIPDYDGMRRSTTELAVTFASPGTHIVDLGCSRGAALKPIYEELGEKVFYSGVEVSDPMREAAILEIPFAEILATDLRHDYPEHHASVTLAVLTLQFIPIEYRQKIIQNVYDSTKPGGAFLLVEKVLGGDAFANELFIETYLRRKGENGYTPDQINRKRESLEGVLVPVTESWNRELLESAGFKHVECYWRQLNFAAWVGVRV
tara:strand:+ start:363 stop:1061 length:699 start_codon:yes stop_codon:yes gene_type:complete